MNIRILITSLIFALLTGGCAKKAADTGATDSRTSPTYAGPAEKSYCSTVTPYAGGVTITGRAEYEAREPFYVNGSNNGLGNPGAPNPIRRAEVQITNSSGTVVQCSETDNSGDYSFVLPNSGLVYTVAVNSRANNSFLYASVLNQPEKNQFYSLTAQITVSGGMSIPTMTAEATGEILGGAFNILDQLLTANEYIKSKAQNCGTTFTGCESFSVNTTKISAYWKKGFNPGSYYGLSSGLSFYVPGYNRLFILGGINGDTDSSDTDHFDNSVIIHEYGHFLEDSVFVSDSPGGSHNGNGVIDPRLAWSEGWGNFLQSAVQGQALYIDTSGNIDGTTQAFFYIDLENVTTDDPSVTGEGNFREFSVTRMLWDAVDAVNDGENISNGFEQIWAVLTKGTIVGSDNEGFLHPDAAFRDVGLFHLGQITLSGGTNWSNVRSVNEQDGDRREYAQYITTTASCSTYSMNIVPTTLAADSDPSDPTHMFKNNNFYHFIQPSTSTVTITLNYQTSAGVEADLDLYIYREDARFGYSNDIVKYSLSSPDCTVSTASTETVVLTNFPAGNYLINVLVYTTNDANRCAPTTSNGGSTNYQLKKNGALLCPDTIF